jgi:hypothetical protein
VWEVLVDHSLEVPRDAAWDGLMSNATMFSNRPIHGGGIFSNPLLEGILSACHVPCLLFPRNTTLQPSLLSASLPAN